MARGFNTSQGNTTKATSRLRSEWEKTFKTKCASFEGSRKMYEKLKRQLRRGRMSNSQVQEPTWRCNICDHVHSKAGYVNHINSCKICEQDTLPSRLGDITCVICLAWKGTWQGTKAFTNN